MRAALGLALLALILPGCTLLDEPEAREVSGPTDGYTPTSAFLKLHVRRDDGSFLLLGFDRRDWYTAGIAEEVDLRKVPFITAEAEPRALLSEYLVHSVGSPSALQAFHYDTMGATAEQRAEMDRGHDELLGALGASAPTQGALDAPPLPHRPAP